MEVKVPLVTGAALGLGLATAKAFAEAGAAVALADWNEKAIKCDVSNNKQAKDMVNKTVEAFGRLDYTYNNAGVQPIRIIHKGEVTICPPNVEHLHGALTGSSMTHVSLKPNADKGVVTWLRPVTDDDSTLPKTKRP